MSKRKKTKARRASASEPPKAPRTEAQLAAARANIERAQEARRNPPPPHPADGPDRPQAFFSFGRGKAGDDAGDAGKSGAKGAAAKVADAAKRVLSSAETESFQTTMEQVLLKLWEVLDKGLTAVIYEPEECFIWRSIDDEDNAFLARRVLREARKNPIIADQVRTLVDHWDDLRTYAIVGPRLAQSMRWIPAHGIDLSAWGGPAVPPHPSRAHSRPSGAGRGQSGPSPYANGSQPASGSVVDEGAYSYGGH